MKSRIILPKDTQDIVNKEANRQFLDIMERRCMEVDAGYLLALHEEFNFGPKRLERAWNRMIRNTEELMNRYDMDDTRESGYAAIQILKRVGFDIEKKYEEVRINGKKLQRPRVRGR